MQNFFIELAFVLTKFSLLHLNKNRETFRTFLSSKKLKINNWVVLAVQCQIISQMLVLKMIFQKSISYTYCIAPRKKIYSDLFFYISATWPLQNLKKEPLFLNFNI